MSGDRQTVAGAYEKIEAHEDKCAVRYEAINETLKDLKGSAKQHERAAWGIVLALLAWMAVQLYTLQTRPAASAQTVVMSQPAGK